MSNWLGNLYSKAYRSVSDLVVDVRNGVATFWDDVTGLANDARSAEGWMLGAVQNWENKERSLLGALYMAVRRAIEVRVPALIAQVVNDVVGLARRELAIVRNEALAGLSTLRSWAGAAFAAAQAFEQRIVAWADARLNGIENWLSHTGYWIAHLLSSPDVLATWLVEAMFRALMAYVQTHADAIARYLVRNAVPLMLRSTDEIETIIADIL